MKMTCALLTLLMLSMAGCSHSYDSRVDDWKMQLVREIQAATLDMNSCASEVWHVDHGPICKRACAEFITLRAKEFNPPAFVGQLPPEEVIEDVSNSAVCKDVNKPSRKRSW